MNGFSLSFKRQLKEWKFQYGVIKSVADWTILLYIILPSLVIGVGIYRSWWIEIPAWIMPIPVELLLLVGYVFSWFGNYRTFVEEADKVFLVKRKGLFLSLKMWSFLSTVFTQIITLLIKLCIFLPFLILHYKLDIKFIILYFLYLVSVKIFLLFGKRHFRKINNKYLRFLLLFLLFTAGSWLTQLVIGLVFYIPILFLSIVWIPGAIGVYFSSQKLLKVSDINEDLLIENEEKLKFIGLIYQFSYSVEKTIPVIRKNPFFFRNSKRLFKQRTATHSFIELFLKVFLRNYTYVFSYLQLIGVTISAAIVSPNNWLASLFFLAFLFIMRWYLDACWVKITTSHPLVEKYKEHPGFYEGKRKIVNVMYVIAIVIVVVFSIPGIYYLKQ